jgi:hypothetical protein
MIRKAFIAFAVLTLLVVPAAMAQPSMISSIGPRVAVRHSEWSPYVGAGMGVNNEAPDRRFGSDLGQTNVGGNLLFGVTAPSSSGSDSRFFTELKLGLGDVPSMKMVAGWNFGL